VYLGRVTLQSYELDAPVPQSAVAEEGIAIGCSEGGEFDLLLACCATAVRSTERIRRPFSAVNWRAFADLAEKHDVMALVYRGLHAGQRNEPQPVLEALRRSYERNAQKNLRLTFELLRTLDCLNQRCIDAIPYKGPVLAEALYGDVGVRQFSDLDILIRARDLAPATAAVASLGYNPASILTEPQGRACLASGYEQAFDGPLGKNLLELQWRVVPKFYAIELNVEDLFARSSYVSLGGYRVRTLSPEDLFLVLCIHAAKHAWTRISWLCDIARTVLTQQMDYEVVQSRAVQLGISRIVEVSLWLANRLLAMPVPAALAVTTGKDDMVAGIGKEVRKEMTQSSEYDVESPDYFRMMLRVRERRKDRTRFLARLAFTPSLGEWAAIQLPGPLSPLYRAVRVARLSRRALSSLLAKTS
jgi:hypothetical protein